MEKFYVKWIYFFNSNMKKLNDSQLEQSWRLADEPSVNLKMKSCRGLDFVFFFFTVAFLHLECFAFSVIFIYLIFVPLLHSF